MISNHFTELVLEIMGMGMLRSKMFYSIHIFITESTGRKLEIKCYGYIGYENIGFWDEMIIESADLLFDDDFLRRCKEHLVLKFGTNIPDSGSPDRNTREWKTLRLNLIDGNKILIVASKFDVIIE